MSTYYAIASIQNMENHYAVKKIETSNDLTKKSKEVRFSIDESNLIYLGVEVENLQVFHNVRYEKLSFFLCQYKTKINKDVYKIDLIDLLGRIAYGNETIYLDESIDEKILTKSLEIEKNRLTKFHSFVELDGEKRRKVIKKFEKLEGEWLDYWVRAKDRLKAFYRKHPKPIKKNYFRSGLSALIFGKFRDDDYRREGVSHYHKLEWLCNKIAEDAESLGIDFVIKCPNGCDEKVTFFVDFEYQDDKSTLYYLDDGVFPHAIYKRLHLIHGACSECGEFRVTYSDTDDDKNFTCLFTNTFPEYLYYRIKPIIQQNIAASIEKDLYGDEE